MRSDISFQSHGSRCAAWLYRPRQSGNRPCIVMAPGFTCVREQRLDAFAERFAEAGFAVLLFDHRHFGASEGQPRQLLSIRRQLQDWEAAIVTARALSGVDPNRIALFGSSFSGGFVQALAQRDQSIAAVIAQVPQCDGLRNLQSFPFSHLLRLTLAGLRDAIGALFRMQPYKVAAIGTPGSLAVLATPNVEAEVAKLNPANSNWRNEVSARIALGIAGFRPGVTAHRIKCPILYVVAEKDDITPAPLAHAAAKRAPRAEVQSYDCGHFDPYVSPVWDQAVAVETQFLVRHLRP